MTNEIDRSIAWTTRTTKFYYGLASKHIVHTYYEVVEMFVVMLVESYRHSDTFRIQLIVVYNAMDSIEQRPIFIESEWTQSYEYFFMIPVLCVIYWDNTFESNYTN